MFWLFIYRALSLLFFIFAMPFIVFIGQLVAKWKESIPQKMGFIPDEFFINNKRQNIWVHAVSFGEVKTIEPLIYELQKSFPLAQIWLSTGTKTGQDLAQKTFRNIRVFYCPFDFYFALNNWFSVIKPDLVLITETEIWPEILLQCKQRKIPAFLINARLTDKSTRNYKFIYPIIKNALNCFTAIYAQSENNKKRFMALGAKENNISVFPNLKFDSAFNLKQNIKPETINQLKNSFGLESGNNNSKPKQILIAGSTHSGEEDFIIDIFKNCLINESFDWHLILAPRHLERLSEIETLCKNKNLNYSKTTEFNNKTLSSGSVLLLDTMGELGLYYTLANIAFIGGTWANIGGHNLLEAVIWNLPICIGQYNYKINDLTESLKENNYPILQSSNLKEITDWIYENLQNKNHNYVLLEPEKTISQQIIKKISQSVLALQK